MPPCAYPVLLSAGSALVRISTRPAAARPIAARSPAIPPPTIRKVFFNAGAILPSGFSRAAAGGPRPIGHDTHRRRDALASIHGDDRERRDRASRPSPRRAAHAAAALRRLEPARLAPARQRDGAGGQRRRSDPRPRRRALQTAADRVAHLRR